MQINIEPEQINKLVSGAILESCLGKEMKKAIEKAVADVSKVDYRVIANVVNTEVRNTVRELVTTEYREQIKTIVQEAMTTEVVHKIVDAAMKALIEKIY